MEQREEFFEKNVSNDPNLFIVLEAELCHKLFERHLEINNLKEFQKYFYCYLSLNGMLDGKLK